MRTNLLLAESQATNWTTVKRLNDVKSGLDWMLAQRGLDENSLTNFSLYPSIPINGTYSVILSNMYVPFAELQQYYYAAYFDGESWYWTWQGKILTTLNFTNSGNYNVVFSSKVPQWQQPPVTNIEMSVYLGPNCVSNILSGTNLVSHTNSFSVPYPGPWDLMFMCNYNDNSGLSPTITQIQITKQ